MYFINWLPVQCPDRSQDIQQRKRYVAMVDNVRENGGDVKIFSSLHVSGEREWGFFILGPGTVRVWLIITVIIIMYIYHALINALSAHMIHINLSMIFCPHVEHSPTKTIYIKYYTKKQTKIKTASFELSQDCVKLVTGLSFELSQDCVELVTGLSFELSQDCVKLVTGLSFELSLGCVRLSLIPDVIFRALYLTLLSELSFFTSLLCEITVSHFVFRTGPVVWSSSHFAVPHCWQWWGFWRVILVLVMTAWISVALPLTCAHGCSTSSLCGLCAEMCPVRTLPHSQW